MAAGPNLPTVISTFMCFIRIPLLQWQFWCGSTPVGVKGEALDLSQLGHRQHVATAIIIQHLL